MSVALYMDVHVPAAISRGLRRRGVEVVTAQEDDAARLADPPLLDRATALGRIIFTRDRDFLAEAVLVFFRFFRQLAVHGEVQRLSRPQRWPFRSQAGKSTAMRR